MEVVSQLCIKSRTIIDSEGVSFTVHQGRKYTTSVPDPDKHMVIVFSTYWVSIPKENFVLAEDE